MRFPDGLHWLISKLEKWWFACIRAGGGLVLDPTTFWLIENKPYISFFVKCWKWLVAPRHFKHIFMQMPLLIFVCRTTLLLCLNFLISGCFVQTPLIQQSESNMLQKVKTRVLYIEQNVSYNCFTYNTLPLAL